MNLNNAKEFIGANAGTILTALSCLGVLGTAACAAHDAVKAREIIEDPRSKRYSKRELAAKVVPCYISTALMASATIACMIGHHQISAGKIAAYASAYTMATKAAAEYRDKVVEVIGEGKAKEIDDRIADERIRRNPPILDQNITGEGPILCYDYFVDRYFRSDAETIRRVVNDLNHELVTGTEMWVSLNDFYDRLGLDPAPIGENLGWVPDDLIDVSFSSRLNDNNIPCLVMRFVSTPIADTTVRY